jgi:NADH/NAD ratio-sensing transcriptional regulator Rex
MIDKIPISKIKQMSSKEIASYLELITQTQICKDVKYCNELCKIYVGKPINTEKNIQLKLF